jgi:phage shock protein PspC (stress-responsive transcriptional regulator)
MNRSANFALKMGFLVGIFAGIIYGIINYFTLDLNTSIIRAVSATVISGILFTVGIYIYLIVSSSFFKRTKDEVFKDKEIIKYVGAEYLKESGVVSGWLFVTSDGLTFIKSGFNMKKNMEKIPVSKIKDVVMMCDKKTMQGGLKLIFNNGNNMKFEIDEIEDAMLMIKAIEGICKNIS